MVWGHIGTFRALGAIWDFLRIECRISLKLAISLAHTRALLTQSWEWGNQIAAPNHFVGIGAVAR